MTTSIKDFITLRNESDIAPHLKAYREGKVKVIARECKHGTYSVDRTFQENSDMLTVKEYLTLDSGVIIPNIRTIKDYKSPYWTTKKHLRTHPEKIEFEDLDNLDMHRSTRINLRADLCFKLGRGNPRNPLRMLARSPYVYGLDVAPEAFVKQTYIDKWPDSITPNHVTVVDVETDMRADFKKAILWSMVNDDEIVLYVSRQWTEDMSHYEDDVREEYHEVLDAWYLDIENKLRSKDGSYPTYLDHFKNLPLRFVTLDDHFEITREMMSDLHKSNTDIVTGWNLFYDMSSASENFTDAGYDPTDFFSDAAVPEQFRSLYLKPGPAYTISASGVKNNLGYEQRWDTMLSTSTFKMVCAMQTHWQLRKAKGKELGGYGLDAIGQRHLGAGKVNFKKSASRIQAGSAPWHFDMQANFKVRYGVYAIFDSVLVKIKEMKDSDLTHQITALAGACDYSRFNSQPTINSTDMLFTGIKEQRKVICSTSDDMIAPLDKLTLGLHDWMKGVNI